MNAPRPDPLETALKRLRPARPSEAFIARLREAQAVGIPPHEPSSIARAVCGFSRLRSNWRWWLPLAAPAMALVVFGMVRFQSLGPAKSSLAERPSAAEDSPRDGLRIDRQIGPAFVAIARLPGGEEVRLRCREWTDRVVWQDQSSGLEIEQRIPRLEVIPVSMETY